MNWFRLRSEGGLRWADALLGIALFAAIVRSLIPQGFMPVMDGSEVSIALCTIEGLKPLEPGQAPDAGWDAFGAAHHACTFSALAGLAPPPSAPIVSLPQAVEAGLLALDEELAGAFAHPFRPQSPRAPPALL